jgi:transposase-like protein
VGRGSLDYVVTDMHQASVRAVRRDARRALHTRTGLHRARGETTKAVERSHVPIKDRLRPMRGLQSVPTGQRLLETIEAVQAIRRSALLGSVGTLPVDRGGAAHARTEVATLHCLASDLRLSA